MLSSAPSPLRRQMPQNNGGERPLLVINDNAGEVISPNSPLDNRALLTDLPTVIRSQA